MISNVITRWLHAQVWRMVGRKSQQELGGLGGVTVQQESLLPTIRWERLKRKIRVKPLKNCIASASHVLE